MKHLLNQFDKESQGVKIEALQLEIIKLNSLMFKCFAMLKERQERVFTDKELALRFSVHPSTIREWRRNGLKSRKEGKTVFILESDFIEWVSEKKF